MKVWFAGADRAWVRRAIVEAGAPLSLLKSFDELKDAMKIADYLDMSNALADEASKEIQG